MAISTSKVTCVVCNKEKETYECRGCSKNYCFNHLSEHRQGINKDFDLIENDHDQCKQKLIHQRTNPNNDCLVQQINQWEKDSIEKVQQIAEQYQEKLIKYANKFTNEIENKLNNLATKMREIRQENQFNEIDLKQLNNQLKTIEEELNRSINISIKQKSTALIDQISVILPFDRGTKWKQAGLTVVGGNGKGNRLNQPFGIYIDDDETMYIADFDNHRIIEWKSSWTSGQILVESSPLLELCS